VCQDLLANLQSRGVRTDRSLLVILDGSKALRKAVRATFGDAALVQRCHVHKMRNVLEYLSDRIVRGAGDLAARLSGPDVKKAQRLLLDLARRLEDEYPARLRACARLGGNADGARSRPLGAPAAVADHDQRRRESDQPHATREAQRQAVAGWQDDAALGRGGVLEAVKGFRRLKGHRDMPTLVATLRARDQRLGLTAAEERVA